jgi:hypothetical protein
MFDFFKFTKGINPLATDQGEILRHSGVDKINHGSEAELEELGPRFVGREAQRVQRLRRKRQFLEDVGIPRNGGRRTIRPANHELGHF